MGSQRKLPPKARQPQALLSREGQLDPQPWLAKMRKANSVSFDNERGVWDIFTYDEVKMVISDHERFNRDPADPVFEHALSYVEPPDHTRIRSAIGEYFTPGTIRELDDRIEEIANELIEEALVDSSKMDFVNDFTVPLPVIVIAAILGVSASERETFRKWSRAIGAAPSNDSMEEIRATRQTREDGANALKEYFTEFIERRRVNPEDDLVSKMIHEQDAQLSNQEILQNCVLLLHGGNITTTNLISNTMRTLQEENLVQAFRDEEISRKLTIEEVLRYRSPTKMIPRVAREDIEIDGTQISEGEPIIAWLAAANRDGDVFEDPKQFKPERRPNRHIAFGDGIHYCIGAPLARLEAKIAFDVFFDKVAGVSFTEDDIEPIYAGTTYGLEQLEMSVTES